MSVSLFSQPSLSPRVFTSVKTEVSYQDLMEYAFLASGLSPEQIPPYREAFEGLLSSLPADRISTSPHPAEELLLELHQRLFDRYQEQQTYIHRIFDSGVYNCVSSAVVYAVACVYFGIPVEGVLTADHAFCRVSSDGTWYDVETTTPFGFNPGQKKEFTNAFGQTGFTYVPPGTYRLRTNIGLVRLISIILKNRAGEAERSGDYMKAVELSVERFALSANELSYREMVQVFLNYASFLNTRGRYTDAISFLEKARERYGLDDSYTQTLSSLVYNHVVTLSGRKAHDEARRFTHEQHQNGNIGEKEKAEFLYLVGDSLGMSILEDNQDPAAASVLIDGLYAEGILSSPRYRDYKIALISREAEALAAAGEVYKALTLVRNSREVFGPHQFFSHAEKVYTHNLAVSYHNAAADLINKGDTEAAERLILEGLGLLPGNPILRADKRTIDAMKSP
ncbi:MAG: hypothetical protein JXB03_03380 [Spirochaetales bacterium]|nr:hypothetical protein [Spirochaetales bacterium]